MRPGLYTVYAFIKPKAGSLAADWLRVRNQMRTRYKSTGTLELVESSKMFFTVTPQEFGSDHAALNISTAEDYNKDSVHPSIQPFRAMAPAITQMEVKDEL